MIPVQALARCFSQYATFTGRASRAEYWWFLGFQVLLSGLIHLIGVLMGSTVAQRNTLLTLYTLAMLLPGMAVTNRRLHDVGRSGWWQLIAWTVVGIIPLVYLYCQPSDPLRNRYGDPTPPL